MSDRERIYLFDTTLREGQQTLPHTRSRTIGEDGQNKTAGRGNCDV